MSIVSGVDLTRTLFVGAMTGTSVDGLDVALVRIHDAKPIQIQATRTLDFPVELRALLLKLTAPSENEVYALGLASTSLGRFIGQSIQAFLEAEGVSPDAVCAIGSHGQTVRHHPEGRHPFTLQIGNPSEISEITGITTVADFRSRDVAAGGQGAPLAPAYHQALFTKEDADVAVLNLGGIANITCLFADGRTLGFDTGPANVLMDSWILAKTGALRDEGGALALEGQILEPLLEKCLQDRYFNAEPPKSTGREYFHLDWLKARITASHTDRDAALKDILATLVQLTAQSIAEALARLDFHPKRIWVTGGGRHNRALMNALSKRTDGRAAAIEGAGIDGDSLEAAAFAWLAHECLRGRPGNLGSVTGATGRRILGAIYPA